MIQEEGKVFAVLPAANLSCFSTTDDVLFTLCLPMTQWARCGGLPRASQSCWQDTSRNSWLKYSGWWLLTRLNSCGWGEHTPLIYQELLHASSRHNATVQGERKRPCGGLAKVIAHLGLYCTRLRLDRRLLPSWLTHGMVPCPLGALRGTRIGPARAKVPAAISTMVWWPSVRGVRTEETWSYWRTGTTVSDSANKGSPEPPQCLYQSGLVFSSCSKPPVETAPPETGIKSERLQVAMCFPTDRDLNTWFDSVYALPIAWPDITDIGTDYCVLRASQKRSVGWGKSNQFCLLVCAGKTEYNVSTKILVALCIVQGAKEPAQQREIWSQKWFQFWIHFLASV